MAYEDIQNRMNELPSRSLSEHDRQFIWDALQTELASQRDGSVNRRSTGWRARPRISRVASLVAAIIIICGGAVGGYRAIRSQQSEMTAGMNLTKPNLTGYFIDKGDWRLEAIPELFQSGPEYDVELIYMGSKSLRGSDVRIWDGQRMQEPVQTQVFKKGDTVGGNGTEIVASNPKWPSFRVTFLGSSHRTETIALGQAGMQTLSETVQQILLAKDANWEAIYTTYTIRGRNIVDNRGYIFINYIGARDRKGSNLSVSLNGLPRFDWASLGSDTRGAVGFYPTLDPSWRVGSGADLQLKWDYGTDTLHLRQER